MTDLGGIRERFDIESVAAPNGQVQQFWKRTA